MTIDRIDLRWLAVLLLAAACAPADDVDAEPIQLVGRIDGMDAFVGITIDAERVFAYACDGTPAGVRLVAWFVGEPSGESFEGESFEGESFESSNPSGATLAGEVSGGAAVGSLVTSDGTSHDFAATTATGDSGLYFGRLAPDMPGEAWGGWVVDGSDQRGAVVDRETGDIVGSPSIDPGAASVLVNGMQLDFARLEEPRDVTLDRLPVGG